MAVNPTAVLAVSHVADAKPASASASMTDGEIRKVDKDAKKLTIKHGPIQNLGMNRCGLDTFFRHSIEGGIK